MIYYLLKNKRTALLNIIIFVIVSVVLLGSYIDEFYQISKNPYNIKTYKSSHDHIVQEYLRKREDWTVSNLGSLLFKFALPNDVTLNNQRLRENKTFIVLIWKHWDWLKNRHLYHFNNKRKSEPLSECSVHNCIITGDDKYLMMADAVVVHLQKGLIPKVKNRNRNQRWIFLTDESPINAFSLASTKTTLADLKNIFNWSMTYRSDADVPVPYGRTIPLSMPLLRDVSHKFLTKLVPYWNIKRRDKLAAILISNCAASKRMDYINKLMVYLPVDVYGKCSLEYKNSCPGHFKSDCKVTREYLFYLVFENSQCKEYLTEKVFNNAYNKGAIPIIMGPKREECEEILPPNSFLHVDNFNSPEDLAKYITLLSENNEFLLEFHRWRNDFKIVNEHGYFGSKSFHYCRVCEALNYNDEREKVYDEEDLRTFLDARRLCH